METIKLSGYLQAIDSKQGPKGNYYQLMVLGKKFNLFNSPIPEGLAINDFIDLEYYTSTYLSKTTGNQVTSNVIKSMAKGTAPAGTVSPIRIEPKEQHNENVSMAALRNSLTYFEIYLNNERANGAKPEFDINKIYELADEMRTKLLNNEPFFNPDKPFLKEEKVE